MGAAGGSRKGGAKFEVLFVLLVIFAFLAAYRLRETGVFDVPSSGSVFARISNQGMLDLINTTAAAQVGWDVASLYESDTNGRVANRVAGMLGDVAGAVSGDAEKLAAWNRILEFAKRNPNPMNVSFLHDALEGKSGLEKDPDAAKRFFSEWVVPEPAPMTNSSARCG